MRPRFRTLLFLFFLVGLVMFVSASSETIVDLAQTCGEDRNQPCQATALPDYYLSPSWQALDGTMSMYHGWNWNNVDLDCGTWTVVAQGWIPNYDAPVEWGGQFINSGDLPPYTHVRYECQYTNGAGTTVFNRTTDTTGCSGGAPYTECHDSAGQFLISAAGNPRFIIRDGNIHCVQDYNQVGGDTDNPNLGQWGRTSIATCTTKPNTIGRTVLAYNGVPPASAWSASSLHEHCDDANYFGVGAILETGTDRCACLGGNNEYLQLDLGSPMTVTGIATQGRPWTEQWVKLYEIQISNDNSVFTRIHCATESGGYCPGNTGWPSTKKFELVSNDLVRPVTARYVRLYIKDHHSYGSIRMGVYVREGWQALRINLENPAYISHLRITPRQDCCQARMDMVQIRVGNDEHEISNNPRCNVGSTKILFFEDTSPYSWTEAWRLALARGGRLPTLTECREYIARNRAYSTTENLWMPVTSPISPDESISRVQIEGMPSSGAEYCRIGNSDTSVMGQGHFADLNTGFDPINLLDAWGTGAHQKMLGVVRDEGIPWKEGDLTVKDIGCFATGKYVWIYTYTFAGQMNFAEVKIMGIEQPWKNLARSCTYGACPSDSNIGFPTGGTDLQKTQNPSRAVDGLFLRHSAFYAGGSVDDPWWRVELQSRADVKMVRITGQMDFASGDTSVNDGGSMYDLDGGGWRLVRRVKQGSSWHPASDNLAGTETYGTYTSDYTADQTFSVPFGEFDQYLFASGDGQHWLITDKDAVGGALTASYYSNAARNIVKSSTSDSQYSATWYNRAVSGTANYEDPWISVTNHNANDMVYGESLANGAANTHHTTVISTNNGANVFVRSFSDINIMTDPLDIRVGDSPIPFKNPVCASGVTRSTLTQFTVHTDADTHSWSEAKAFAESQGGRLPTLNELRHYEATTSYFATANFNHWIPVLNHMAPSGADYFMGYNGHGYSIGHSRWERDPSDGDPIGSTFGTQDWTGVGEYGVWVSTDSVVVPCVGEGNFVFVTKAGTATSFSLMQVEVLGTYQESCPVNHYGQTPVPYAAVVSVDDTTFDRGVGTNMHTHIDLGERTWNIQSNGGFTAVARFMFTGTPNDCTWCRIFDFSSGADSYNILLSRAGDNQRFHFSLREGSTVACSIEKVAHEIHFDHWQTAVARYRAADNTMELTISSDNHIDRIFHGSEDPITFRTTCTSITDRVSSVNYIGKSASNDDYFHGKIAGVHAFDYYLTDAECEAVLHTIVYGASRHTGAWMDYAGVGRDGSFGNIGPVVSVDDTWFDRTHPIDLGPTTWNLFAGGGFTIVSKFRFTNTVSSYETIFLVSKEMNDNNKIAFLRYGTTTFYVFYSRDSNWCTRTDLPVSQNEWNTLIFRYQASSNELTALFNGVMYKQTCTAFSAVSNPYQNLEFDHTFLGKNTFNDPVNHFDGDIGGLYAFGRFMSLPEAQEVLDGIEVNTTFLDARDCIVYDFTGTNSLSSFQTYATSVGISTSLNSWDSSYGVNGAVWAGGWTVGWIQIPLIAGYDTVSIEYGHGIDAHIVTLCVCSTTGVTCDDAQCEIKQTPSPNTRATFSTKYVPGGSIVIQEDHAVIDDNLIIKFTNGPNCQRLFPGNDFLGTQFLETKALNMSDGLVSRFKLEGDLTDTECADPCIDWSVEWIEDTIAPWGHDAFLEWATSYTLSPWTGTGAAPQSRPLFAHELIYYLSSHENINFPVGGDEWAPVRNNADDAYTWVQVASGAWAAYKYLHTTEYQDSSGYSHTSASWDGYMFRMVPSIREITTNELELARMCGANSDQPCNVIGSTDSTNHEFSCVVSTCSGSGWHSTTTGVTEWLRIDLGQASRVNRIVVHPPNHGGGNYYAGRVDGIQIHVGDIESVTDNSICGMIQVPLDGTQNTNPGPFALDCNLKGQYVYMRWLENDGDWKQAGSVYVYGHRLPTFHYDNIRGQVLDNSAQQHYIRSAELSSVLDQDSFTVSVWVKTDDFSVSNHIVNRYDLNEENGERGGMAWYILTDKRVLCQRSYTGGNSWVEVYSNTLLVEHQWYHLTYVSSPKELRLYINGVFDNSDTAPADWAFTQQYTTNKIGIGLYCTPREFTPVFHYDDIDVTGTQALNAGQSTWNFAQNQGFGVVIKMKWTAAAYYEGFFSFQSTSNSHKIELIRLDTSSALYVHWYDANGVGCNSPHAAGPGGTTHGIPTPSDTWFTMKILYDHSSKQLCQWVNGDEKCHTCPSNFVLTDTVMDSWLGATSQTNSFSGAIAGVYAFDHTLNSHEHNDVENSIQIETTDFEIDLGCYEHHSAINRGHRQDLRFYNTALSAEAIGRVASYPGNNAAIVTHTTLPSRDIRNLVVSVDDTNFIPRFFSVGSGTFSQVQASCLSAGGKLASIHNAEEQREAYDICLQVVGGGYGCYIGITADGTGQPWYWADGSTMEYTNWGGTEGGSGGNAGEETVAIFMSYSSWVGEWGDWGTGADSFPGICKRIDDSLLPHPVSFLDFGPKQFNLVSDGGFTLVMKVKWTGIVGSYEKVFDFATGMGGSNLDGEILLARYGTDRRVYFRIFEGSTNMGTASSDYIIMQDQWYSIVCRYTAYSNLMELKIDDYHYTTIPSVGIKDRMASSAWIGKSHWGNAYFNGEIAGLYAFSASLTDREVDRILAGIHINATDNFETSHHDDIVLHDTHQTCSACPGDMYAPAGSTGMSQCQHQCPAGTYAESVRLYPSDRNVDASRPSGQGEGSHTTDILEDFATASSVYDNGGLDCVQIDLGSVYPVSKVHIWQVQDSWLDNGRKYNNQQILLSETGLWTSTEQTGDELIAWSCSTNCPLDPSSGAGRIIEFEPTNARFVRHCSEGNNENTYNHWVEFHVYGTLCTNCPAGSHSPRGSTSHSDCLCESQHPRDYGNYTDKYMADRTGVKGWTLAKSLSKDATKWYTHDHMYPGQLRVGTAVHVRFGLDWYGGKIVAINDDGTYTNSWDDGTTSDLIHGPDEIRICTESPTTSAKSTACEDSSVFAGIDSEGQMTKPIHPDWTEILFVRAPKTANEKWVRMSREVWDSIAGEDYGGGWVDAPILAAYPATTATTARVYKRHDTYETNGGGTPWIYAPTGSSGQVGLHADTAIHAQYEPTSYARNGQWYDRINDPANPYPILDTEFQVFVRAPTWQDHYIGCLDTSGGDPPGYNLGQISSVNTFVDALLICSNYEYFTISCGHRVDCLHTFNDNLLVTDNACRGQPELTPGINSGTDSFCVPPTYPNIGSDGASMGGYAKNAVYSTKSRTHTCQAKDLNCGMGEAVHSEVTLNLEPNDGDDTPGVRGTSYFYVRNGECGGSEISMLDQFSASTKEEQEQGCADVCLAHTGWKASGFILHTALNTCYCEYADSSGSACAPQWGDGWHRYDFYPTHAEISNMAYLAGGRLPTPYELRTWLLDGHMLVGIIPTSHAEADPHSIAAVYNPERLNGEDWMWLNGRFATQLYSDHQVVMPTTPQSPYPDTHWIGTEIPVVISGVSHSWHCYTGSAHSVNSWTQSCQSACPYPSAAEVLTTSSNWCQTSQNLLSNTEARMANCGGGTYDWGANKYCPSWNPAGSPQWPGADAVYVILDAGSPVEVKAFKWMASGNSNRMHGAMRVYRSDDAVTWTSITTFDVSAAAGGSLDDTNPDATVEDMVGVFGNYNFGTARYWKFSPYGAQWQVNAFFLRICSTATCKPARQLVTAFDTPTCRYCPTSNAKENALISMDDRSFVRANSDYVNMGMRSFTLKTGFTAVTKIRFTGSIASHEKVFCFGFGATDNILLSRYSTQDKLYFQIIEGDPANACTLINQYQFPQNKWLTVVARWRSADNFISLIVDGNEYSATCSNGITSRVFIETYIGKSHWSDPFLDGDIAGLYIWDSYLNDIEVASVTQGIHINEKDDLHPDTCMDHCPSGTYRNTAFHGAVISQDDASFVRSAEYSVRLTFNPLTWHLQTQGVTIIMKVKPTGTKAYWERIFAFNNNPVNVDGDFLVSRMSNTDKWWFNMHNKCAAQSDDSASLFGQNIWMTFICRYNQNTQTIEMSINGNVFTSSCSGVVNVVTADHIIGYDYDSGNHRYFEGSVAGFYAWDRYLSDAEVTKVVDSIHIAATDDSLESTCACAADTYARKEITIHFHSIGSLTVSWDDAVDYATGKGGRLPTKDEMIVYTSKLNNLPDWSDPSVYICDEDGGHDCLCHGWVRYGAGTQWTPDTFVYDKIYCGSDSFAGGDPAYGTVKDCWCYPKFLGWVPISDPHMPDGRNWMYLDGQHYKTFYQWQQHIWPTMLIADTDSTTLYDGGGSFCTSDNNCARCQGDCDNDGECLGHLVCFQRDGFTAVPGCDAGGSGDVDGHDYCVDPNYLPALHDVAANNELSLTPVASADMNCDSAGYLCSACEGDCDTAADCKAGLECYQRTANLDVVPGCETTGLVTSRDYCYDPNIPVLGDHNVATYEDGGDFCTSSNPCSKCQGDCDSSSDCQGGLLCWQRGGGSDLFYIPGCQHLNVAETTGYDFCYDPKDMFVPEQLTVSSLVWVNTEENCHACQHGAGAPVGSVEGDCACKSPTYQSKSTVDPDVEAIVGSTGWNLIKELPAYGTTWYTNDELSIRKQTVGAGKIYDFTDMNTLNDWKAYASKIGATTSIQSYGADGVVSEAVWAASGWIGWLELPLPDNFDTVEIDWGQPYTSGVTKLCICNTLGQVNSGLANEGYGHLTTYTSRCDNINSMGECTVVQHPIVGTQNVKYGPLQYQKGQVVRIEEIFSTLNPNIVIKLTNSQGYDDVPTPHFISNVVVDGCRRPNNEEQCRQAVPNGYTFDGAGSYSSDGCYCYESGTYANTCWYGTTWAYRNTLPTLTLPKFRPCLPETSFECIPYSFQACENAIPEGFTLSTISSANQDGCYCYTRDSASGNNANWCYYGTGGQDWVDPGVVSETATQFRPYGYDCGNQPESFTYVPDDEEWDEILFTREPHTETYECTVTTITSYKTSETNDGSGYEGQPCAWDDTERWWYASANEYVTGCRDVGSSSYPYGWCNLDWSGDPSFGSGSKWGHCKPEKDICYTCTVTEDGNQRHHVEGSPCKFPWTVDGDASQNPYLCREIGTSTYPNGWCTPDDLGVGHADHNYHSSSVSSWGECVTGKCLARTTNNGMDWIHVTKASFDANLAHNYSPQWLEVPVLDWSGRGATDMTGLSNYIEHTGIHALSSPWLTLAPYTGVSVTMDHMIYHEEGNYYDPVGHDWSLGDKPMGTRFRTFVRNSKTSLDPPVITLNPVNNYRTFASTSDVLDMGSENRFNIKTNGGLTIVMKFRIHSGIGTSGQYPSIFAFKEGAGTGRQNNFYLNIANEMYFTLVKEDISDVYGTTACGMSYLTRPPENEFVDMVLVYDKNAQLFSVSFSHINSGSAQTSACPVDLGDRMGRFHFNDNLVGSNEGTGFLGDIAGFFAFDRVLSNEAINVLKSSIHTDKQNDPISQTIVTDDPFVCLNTGVVASESGTDNSCPAGQELISNTCYSCPTGKYKDHEGTGRCSNCAVNKNTASTGAGNSNLCQCIAGYFNSNPDDACLACDTGKYRAGLGSAVACDDCPTGSTTLAVAQDENLDCKCNAGFTGPDGAACSACAADTYKPNIGSEACTNCPEGGETVATGQTSISACACTKPNYIDGSGDTCVCDVGYGGVNECSLCPAGKTKATADLEECTECGSFETSTGGSSPCVCDTGYFRLSGFCEPCAANTFKANPGDEACSICGDGTNAHTTSTASTSITDCEANAGYYSTDGSFSPCPAHATSPAGSTSDMACLCNAGYGYDAQSCQICAAGKYKTSVENSACSECDSAGNGWGAAGLTDPAQCECKAGFTENLRVGPDDFSLNGAPPCEACEAGKYKESTGLQTCTDCPEFSSSTTTGNDEVGDCKCNAGSAGIGGVCSLCQAGTYSTGIDNPTCTTCPDYSSTPSTGSVAVEDCICNAGAFGSAGSCSLCEAGKYSVGSDNPTCTDCLSFSTSPEASTDPSACQCNAGYTSSSGSCVACLANEYKAIVSNNGCTSCPENSQSVEASDDISDCQCNAGFAGPNGGPCTACHYGKFKDFVGPDTRLGYSACEPCASEQTINFATAATSYQQCSCNSGTFMLTPENAHLAYYYDASDAGTGACEPCPSGSSVPDQWQYTGTFGDGGYVTTYSQSGTWPTSCTNCGPNSQTTGIASQCECEAGFVKNSASQCESLPGGYFTQSVGETVKVELTVQVSMTLSQFDSNARYQYREGVAEAAEVRIEAVTIVEVTEMAAMRRRLLSSQLNIKTAIEVPAQITTDTVTTNNVIESAEFIESQLSVSNVVQSLESKPAFQSTSVQVTSSASISGSCPENSVAPSGATSRSQCVCNAGYTGVISQDYGSCIACESGKYQETSISCADCPGNSDSAAASDAISQCSCNAGYHGSNGGSCTACSEDTFKPTTGDQSCTDCTPFSSTNGLDAQTSTSACICNTGYLKQADETCDRICAAGFEASSNEQTCVQCPAGKFKDSIGDGSCQLCPDFSVMTIAGATSVDDCLCQQGYVKTDGGSCTACTPGKFTSQAGEPECHTCYTLLTGR